MLSNRYKKKLMFLYVFFYLVKGYRTLLKVRKNPHYWVEAQNKEIEEFVKYIYSIPFYKKRFDEADVSVADIKCREDFKKLPVLTKQEYREWLLSETTDKDKFQDWMYRQTTGSSGTPLVLYSLPTDRAHEIANLFRCALIQEKGYNPFFSRVFSTMTPKPQPQKRYSIPYNGKMSSISSPAELVEGYNKARPDFYYGNKTAVLMIAQYALEHHIKLHRPLCVGSISEALDSNAIRIINKAYGEGLLFDIYGCAETGNFAADKSNTPGKHIVWNDTHVVNLFNEEHVSENVSRGQLMITSLVHHGFPLVNYLVGDTIELTIENEVPYITKIIGRTNDVIKNVDGSTFKWMHINRIMFGITDVTQFRIIQKSLSELTFVLAASDQIDEVRKKEIETIILSKSQQLFGSDMTKTGKKVHFDWCKRIPPDPTGKVRILVSEL